MKKRIFWRALASFIIILASIGICWFYLNRPAQEAGRLEAQVTSQVKADNVARPMLERAKNRSFKHPTPAHRKLGDGELPGQVIAQVAASADANTPDGDYATAIALQRCAYVSGTDAEIEERETRDSLRADALRQSAGIPISNKAAIDETIEIIKKMKEERESCAGIPKDVMSSWRARLEAMAQAGDAEARQRLIHSISIDFPSQTEIDANPDEYAHRIELAEDYLLDRVSDGDCSHATLTSLTSLGIGAKPSYVFYRIYAERALASMPRSDLLPEENDRMIDSLKNTLVELQAQVPLDAMDDANQTVAYLQRTSCRL